MELPHLGKQCSKSDCKKLDFLSIKCDACSQTFCGEHYSYLTHNCPNTYKKDNQVPVCPLCNIPCPVGRGQQPDVVVGAHIDNDCQADPAKSRRKVFTNRCSFKKCKNKEVIPVICSECKLNFCLKHRHAVDHSCEGKNAVRNKWASNSQPSSTMSEDEALARALALSMQDSRPVVTDKRRQEELDAALARQLQASEQNTTASSTSTRDRCNVS
ncbi:unnamed protein product [Brassicogethes aeneus]|uniref:AN1-type domain-containing protein n=1 Tax=Brassicogethes aeneus TaxID=1431903 RepID=A0A9P0BHZ7_BRAAE|nr:unnamed protein product [Brassicogethes aeneus]